jgi:hypothetical protein
VLDGYELGGGARLFSQEAETQQLANVLNSVLDD